MKTLGFNQPLQKIEAFRQRIEVVASQA